MFEKLRDEFGSKKRERCVRLDIPLRAFEPSSQQRVGVIGLEECEWGLKECIRANFEARQAAYNVEVKKWQNGR